MFVRRMGDVTCPCENLQVVHPTLLRCRSVGSSCWKCGLCGGQVSEITEKELSEEEDVLLRIQ